MPKRINDGLKKRCGHAKKTWPDSSARGGSGFTTAVASIATLTKRAEARSELPPRSKSDACTWRDRLRVEIRNGTFADPAIVAPATQRTDTRLTLGDICDRYVKAHVERPTRRQAAQEAMRWGVGLLRVTEIPGVKGAPVRLEDKPIEDLTGADIEAVRDARRAILARARETIAAAALRGGGRRFGRQG